MIPGSGAVENAVDVFDDQGRPVCRSGCPAWKVGRCSIVDADTYVGAICWPAFDELDARARALEEQLDDFLPIQADAAARQDACLRLAAREAAYVAGRSTWAWVGREYLYRRPPDGVAWLVRPAGYEGHWTSHDENGGEVDLMIPGDTVLVPVDRDLS